jgi:hypothetical protein
MSKSKDLMQDAIRDLEGIGAKDLAKTIRSLGKIDGSTPIEHEGVLFTTYSLFRSGDKKGNTRVVVHQTAPLPTPARRRSTSGSAVRVRATAATC